MTGDDFALPGWDTRGSYAGLAFVPGTDAYVRQIVRGDQVLGYQAGWLGLADARTFNDLGTATTAARALVGARPAASPLGQTGDVQAYDAFWGSFQGEPLAAAQDQQAAPPRRGLLLAGLAAAFLLRRR